MNKIRSLVPVSVVVSLGALAASACGSFSSAPSGSDTSGGSGNDTSTNGGSGDSTSTSGGSGDSTSTSGGSGDSTSTSGGTTSSGGSSADGGTTSSGGSSADGGTTSSGGSSATGGSSTTGGGGGGSGSTPTVCDILAAAGNPCVAAHSTTRLLYTGYTGPLYQVCKGSSVPGQNSCTSGTTQDIGLVNGVADSASQDTFCAGNACTISIIYDQSPKKNDLKPGPAGGAKNSADNPANATALKTTLAGHSVYGILIKPGIGYRRPTAAGTATGDQPETEYMVSGQQDLVDGCCFDYGNAETDSHDDGNGTMEAVYLGLGVVWGTGVNGGPWVEADLENGLYAGWENNQDRNISTNTPLAYNFITAVVIGDTQDKNSGKGRFALYGGDATNGMLKTMYDGIRPNKQGYVPMAKQGSIILGIGGDNSDGDGGRWYEGVMASGAATAATVNALQANIVAAGYGK
jgi:hypothetical protein